MLPDRVSNPGSLALESDALPTELRQVLCIDYLRDLLKYLKYQKYLVCKVKQVENCSSMEQRRERCGKHFYRT